MVTPPTHSIAHCNLGVDLCAIAHILSHHPLTQSPTATQCAKSHIVISQGHTTHSLNRPLQPDSLQICRESLVVSHHPLTQSPTATRVVAFKRQDARDPSHHPLTQSPTATLPSPHPAKHGTKTGVCERSLPHFPPIDDQPRKLAIDPHRLTIGLDANPAGGTVDVRLAPCLRLRDGRGCRIRRASEGDGER